MKNLLVLCCLITFVGCNQKSSKSLSAQDVIDRAIEVSGGVKFDSSIIEFDFRDKHYYAERNHGAFKLVRTFKDSTGKITDFLTNKGFERHINNKPVKVPDSMLPRYSASVNSVHYFSVLPYGLNDKAVIKELLGETTIKEVEYYKIKVTFKEVGGGEDFEDVFVYWINQETFKVDFLAYSYEEIDGTGFRFREAYNERYINDLRFVDYNNYKPKQSKLSVEQLDELFENDELELLSKIELKNISVG